MKQRITIPEKVTQGVFELPCVHSVRKDTRGIVYYIKDEGYAYPGDILEEDNRGKWRIIKKEGGE